MKKILLLSLALVSTAALQAASTLNMDNVPKVEGYLAENVYGLLARLPMEVKQGFAEALVNGAGMPAIGGACVVDTAELNLVRAELGAVQNELASRESAIAALQLQLRAATDSAAGIGALEARIQLLETEKARLQQELREARSGSGSGSSIATAAAAASVPTTAVATDDPDAANYAQALSWVKGAAGGSAGEQKVIRLIKQLDPAVRAKFFAYEDLVKLAARKEKYGSALDLQYMNDKAEEFDHIAGPWDAAASSVTSAPKEEKSYDGLPAPIVSIIESLGDAELADIGITAKQLQDTYKGNSKLRKTVSMSVKPAVFGPDRGKQKTRAEKIEIIKKEGLKQYKKDHKVVVPNNALVVRMIKAINSKVGGGKKAGNTIKPDAFRYMLQYNIDFLLEVMKYLDGKGSGAANDSEEVVKWLIVVANQTGGMLSETAASSRAFRIYYKNHLSQIYFLPNDLMNNKIVYFVDESGRIVTGKDMEDSPGAPYTEVTLDMPKWLKKACAKKMRAYRGSKADAIKAVLQGG